MPTKLNTMLPGPLQIVGKKVKNIFEKKKYKVTLFTSVSSNVPYKVHFLCKKKYESIAIEVRQKCDVHKPFSDFVDACHAHRIPVKIYYAVPDIINGDETYITHNQRAKLKEKGIGLLIVKKDEINEDLGTIPCHRKLSLEPGSTLGAYSKKIHSIIDDYNLGECMDSIRDLSEEVEDATTRLFEKAIRKGLIIVTQSDLSSRRYSWEDKINILSTNNYKNHPQHKILEADVSRDLKAFKDVRNLSDHRKTKRELRKLEQQYPDKMLLGIRILRELVKSIRSI